VLRLTSSAVTLCALGVSAAVHAAALVVPVGPFGHSGAASVSAPDDALVIDLLTEQAPPEPEPEVMPSTGRATIWPTHTHPYPVPASHDATPHDPNLVHVAAAPAAPAAPAPADTTTDDTPSFTIAVGPTGGDSFGKVSATGTAAPHEEGALVVPEQLVDTQARLLRGVAPSYPAAARGDGVEGDVHLELIVGVAGGVESAHVVRGVGRGLDEAALGAVRQFRFAPATKDGHAVRVRMGWSMQFRLQ
jgi:protein TonB